MSSNTIADPSGSTAILARFAAGLRFEDIPPTVVERIKLHVLDGLGVCLHGSALPWTRMVREMIVAEGGNSSASLWGCNARTSVSQAVLINCTAGHAFEMDDIHKESVLHPNSLAIPVALALAESGASTAVHGADVMTAIIAGYEVGTRVGNAATTALFLNGFHPQGTSGAFVAAATAGKMLGLDDQQMQHALGIAGSMGAGLMAAQEGAMVKRLHAGKAAQSGVYAAMLAKRGFTGIHNILEAEYGGFLSSFSREYDLRKLTDELGSFWEAGKVGFKLYPNVTSIHTALDALQSILVAERLGASDIASIKVGCGHMTFVHTAWPYVPHGVTAAQMNLYYGLAVMATRGRVSAQDYEPEKLADPGVLAFINRIEAYEDAEIESMGPAYRHACNLSVTTAEGSVHKRRILARRGSPEDDVQSIDIENKFRTNVTPLLPANSVLRLVELTAEFDSLSEIKPINDLLRI